MMLTQILLTIKLLFYLHASRIIRNVDLRNDVRNNRQPPSIRTGALQLAWSDADMWDLIWTECVRLGLAFGLIGLVILFWYWLMDSLGTF